MFFTVASVVIWFIVLHLTVVDVVVLEVDVLVLVLVQVVEVHVDVNVLILVDVNVLILVVDDVVDVVCKVMKLLISLQYEVAVAVARRLQKICSYFIISVVQIYKRFSFVYLNSTRKQREKKK